MAELELPTLFGVTPVEGTIWDLGPDGLEFLRPATLVLEYDESALPEGATEEDLGVYVINGIFEQLPSTTDTEANTITAEIGHFTLAFTAVDLGESLDLELTSFSQLTSSDPEVGQPVEFSAEVRNNGPGTGQATVLYQVQGPVLLGDVADSCREVDPDFGDFAVSCALPFLGVGDFESAAAFQVIPLQGGEVVTVRATAVPAGQDRDENPDNDTRELGFTAGGGGGAIADLRAGGGPSSGSDPRVGGLMEWVGRVDNLGPGASSGGTMVLAANGDIVLGDVPADCTTQFDIPGILASIECPVDPLAAFGIDLVGPLRFTAQSAGDIEVWATVTPASGDTDPNPDNDEASTTITVAETFLVDLAPTSQSFGGVPGPEGALTFRARVGNFLPPSNGGVMIYEAIGDAIFGSVDNSCTASVPSPSVLRLLCPFDPFPTALTDAPVAFIQVVPQSNGVVTFRATTVPVAGDTDVDPSNDQLEVGVAVGERQVDLELASLTTDGQTVGQPIDVLADVRNLGPDDSRGARVVFTAFGDVTLGSLVGSCFETPPGAGDVAVVCDVGALAVGELDGNSRFQFIPQAAGPVTVSAIARALYSQDVDANRANDRRSVVVEVQ